MSTQSSRGSVYLVKGNVESWDGFIKLKCFQTRLCLKIILIFSLVKKAIRIQYNLGTLPALTRKKCSLKHLNVWARFCPNILYVFVVRIHISIS